MCVRACAIGLFSGSPSAAALKLQVFVLVCVCVFLGNGSSHYCSRNRSTQPLGHSTIPMHVCTPLVRVCVQSSQCVCVCVHEFTCTHLFTSTCPLSWSGMAAVIAEGEWLHALYCPFSLFKALLRLTIKVTFANKLAPAITRVECLHPLHPRLVSSLQQPCRGTT